MPIGLDAKRSDNKRSLHNTALAALFSTFRPVIYMSKLPVSSVTMPCDYRILQSPTKEQEAKQN